MKPNLLNRARSLHAKIPSMASDLRSVRRRAAVVAGVLLTGLVGMTWRAYQITVVHHDEYAAQGNRQQLRPFTLDASRGDVLDRNAVSLAVNDYVERVVLNPRVVRGQNAHDRVLATLVSILGPEHAEHIRDNLSRDKAYRRLKIRMDEDQARAVRKAMLPGVRLEKEPERVYPRAHLASHVLGRVNAESRGHLGIELGMERELAGREATSPAFFASHRGRGTRLLVDGHPDTAIPRGQDVVLTLDSAVQAMAEEEIDTLVENWHPVGASVIVLDPKSGEILALANRPTFDPNHRVPTSAQTVNLAVQAAYEPGSTMKAITVAAALEQRTIRPNQTFFCEEGKWQYTPQHAIRDTKVTKWLDVTEILAASSNICTTKIYETLGSKRALYEWAQRFHFGERPAVQLPGAHKGSLGDWKDWSDIRAANVSFGQGMSASPLQVAAAFGAIANGGVFNAPTMVRHVIDGEGEIVWRHEPTNERVVRDATADTVVEMLTAVVHSPLGTGKKAKIKGYTVAGKTSTAQKAASTGGYAEDLYYASFVGAVPAEDPRVVILVSVDEPEGGHYGNDVAAPTFSRLGTRVMAYLGVPRNDGKIESPEQIALQADDSVLVNGFLPGLDVEPSLPGKRKVAFTTGLPDFTGLTIAQAYDAAEQAGVELRASGSGLAVGQDTAPGPVLSGTTVRVHFEPAG